MVFHLIVIACTLTLLMFLSLHEKQAKILHGLKMSFKIYSI